MCDELFYDQINTNSCFDKDATLVIKQDAIINNVKYLKDSTGAKIIAVVKENGYGLGVANLYNIIKDQGIFMYAVTAPCEAIALRREGCEADILLLTPISDFSELLMMVTNDVVIALGDDRQFPELVYIHELTGKKPRVHIQIDSGLGRYGFNLEDLPNFKRYEEHISIEGCFTHLAGSNSNYKRSVEKQVCIYKRALEKIRKTGVNPGICHVSNTRAALTFGSLGFDAIRVGSALLGKAPIKSNLEEAVWLESKVFSVYNRLEGEHIGYSGEASLKRDSYLAVVRIGTSCGIGLIQKGAMDFSLCSIIRNMIRKINSDPVLSVWINGKESPVIGRIGVSHMTIDVTENSVCEGDTVRVRVNPLFVHPYVERMVI